LISGLVDGSHGHTIWVPDESQLIPDPLNYDVIKPKVGVSTHIYSVFESKYISWYFSPEVSLPEVNGVALWDEPYDPPPIWIEVKCKPQTPAKLVSKTVFFSQVTGLFLAK